MAQTETRLATAAVNAQAKIHGALLDGGLLRIYSGSQPDDADDLIKDQILLAELRFGTPAFKDPVGGEIEAHAIQKEKSAKAKGRAAFFRCVMADGLSPVMDGSAGPEGSQANLELKNVNIEPGMEVSVTRFRHIVPRRRAGG